MRGGLKGVSANEFWPRGWFLFRFVVSWNRMKERMDVEFTARMKSTAASQVGWNFERMRWGGESPNPYSAHFGLFGPTFSIKRFFFKFFFFFGEKGFFFSLAKKPYSIYFYWR